LTAARYDGYGGGDQLDIRTRANHLHLIPVRSPTASTPAFSFLEARCHSCRPTNRHKALKAFFAYGYIVKYMQKNANRLQAATSEVTGLVAIKVVGLNSRSEYG